MTSSKILTRFNEKFLFLSSNKLYLCTVISRQIIMFIFNKNQYDNYGKRKEPCSFLKSVLEALPKVIRTTT